MAVGKDSRDFTFYSQNVGRLFDQQIQAGRVSGREPGAHQDNVEADRRLMTLAISTPVIPIIEFSVRTAGRING